MDVDRAGAGALGKAILIRLVKIGCGIADRITVTNPDTCEPHNLPAQWFRAGHASSRRPKVAALAETIESVCGCRIEPVRARFTGSEGRLGPVLILSVDSIEERAGIWSRLRNRRDVRFLVDARTGADVVKVHALVLGRDPHEVYERSLHDPADSFRDPCTHRSIASTALGAAAFVGSLLRAYVKGRHFSRHLVFDFRNFWIERSRPARRAGCGPVALGGVGEPPVEGRREIAGNPGTSRMVRCARPIPPVQGSGPPRESEENARAGRSLFRRPARARRRLFATTGPGRSARTRRPSRPPDRR